jgi:hypothetical protein
LGHLARHVGAPAAERAPAGESDPRHRTGHTVDRAESVGDTDDHDDHDDSFQFVVA